METPRQPDRRTFLQRLGTLTGGSLLAAQLPAFLATMDLACASQEAGAPLRVLTGPTLGFVDAVAARIIPSDHRPGAREAHVVRFIDMVLDTMPSFTGAVELLEEARNTLEADAGMAFTSLSEDQQDESLRGIEGEVSFQILQFLTVAGFLVHPSRGGNAGKVGWQLVGFDDRHAWTPPFGYYDADAHGPEATT